MGLGLLRRAAPALVAGSLAVFTSGCVSLLPTSVPALRPVPTFGCPWEHDPARCLAQDFPGYTGALGISDSLASEREADGQARADAIQKLLAHILGVEVATELRVTQVEQVGPGAAAYRAQVRLEGRFAVTGTLPGFELLRRSVRQDPQGRYVVRVLIGVRDASEVRRAFFAELAAALSASRARLERYLRARDFPPEPFTEAARRMAGYLEAAERFQARLAQYEGAPGGFSRNLRADRAFLSQAEQAFQRHYDEVIDGLVARDEYGEAAQTALRLLEATQDGRWQRRADEVLSRMLRRARALWEQQAFEAALQVLVLPEPVKRYLSEHEPARLAEVVAVAARTQAAEQAERRRPPRAPAPLDAVVDDQGIRLSWQPQESRPVTGYRIYRAQGPVDAGTDRFAQTDFRLLAEIAGVASAYLDRSASPGYAYAYRVSAVSEAGVEGPPGEVRVVYFYHPLAPPLGLRIERGDDGTYLATWSYPYPAELVGYRVWVAPDGEEEPKPQEVSVALVRFGPLRGDQRYELRVAAVRRDGQQGPWASLAFWTPPPPPRNVRFEQTPQGLVVRWQPSSRQPLAAVRLYEAAEPPRLVGERSLAELADTRWVVAGLAVGRTYRLYLTQVSSDGLESAPSEVSAVTLHSYPSRVEGLRASPLGPSGVLLSWQPASEPDVAEYRVERRAEGEEGWTAVARVRFPSYVDRGLQDDTHYAYRVVAVNRAGVESPPASVEWVTRPRLVTELRAEAAGDRSVVLRWTDANRHAVSGYRVERQNPDGSVQEVGRAREPRLRDEGLRYGTEYRYRVVAWRDSLVSEPSGWQTVTVHSYPPPVSGLAAKVLPDGSVRLSWQPNSEEDVRGYRVYRQENGADQWVMRGTTSIPQFVEKAEDGQRYRYRVVAYNAVREGEPAELAVLTRPLAPVDVQAEPVTGGVLVTWADPNAVAPRGYRMYRGLVGTRQEQLQLLGEVRDRLFVDRGALVSGVMYVYHVSAINLDGVEGALSSPALFRAP